MTKRKPVHPFRRRPLLIAGGFAVVILYLAGAQVVGWWPHLRNTGDRAAGKSPAQTTSTASTAQSNFNGGTTRPTTTNNNTAANGAHNTVTDTNGAISTAPPGSDWSKSADGSSIVVYTPAANSLLTSGDSLSGSSTQPSVSFRLVDNLSGVIGEGKLTVVNGKFSGTFSFSTKATAGQIDLFNQAADGTESNNVTIPVRFTP